jgi:hypothetical protein
LFRHNNMSPVYGERLSTTRTDTYRNTPPPIAGPRLMI